LSEGGPVADAPGETTWTLVSAADALGTAQRIAVGRAASIPALDSIPATMKWLHEVRLACERPPPEAAGAAEWLLDNDYQAHRALREIRNDLPSNFYARLAALDTPDRLPRVFSIAHHYLRATRMQISLSSLVRFVTTYQKRQTLTIAELWALPTMLRIGCIEILVSALTLYFPGQVELPFEPSSLAVQSDQLDRSERVARGIANLATIAAIPWKQFFDRTSRVEELLSQDPSGHYRQMDFDSRDSYRRAVERIATQARLSEEEVARLALEQARRSAGTRKEHVGFWLVGEGVREFETALQVHLPLAERLRRLALDRPGPIYATALVVANAVALVGPALYLYATNAGALLWVAAFVLALIPASTLSVAFVHWAFTQFLPPRILPKLNFSKGLSADCPTAIAVPVIVASASEASFVAEQVEAHWLSNADPQLRVVLLADPPDSAVEQADSDTELEATLTARIIDLNERYGRRGRRPFHLLMRRRRFNPSEGCWMAWERKRGKLEQFNRLLIDGSRGDFGVHIGDPEGLAGVRFVVTVDADTELPPGSVARLAGTLAHPLNAPDLDDSGRPRAGYSIVQPRSEISPRSGFVSRFARIYAGDTAIDIYSRAASDVYQDLFGAGIFVGKGIYDVRCFHRALDGRIPENRILSHDLFEGAHGRTALASDIILHEGFPASYLEYARRLHRWTRGDWQLLSWLGPRVPAADGSRLQNPLAGVDRWKILDNLRRSLVAPTTVALAIAGWFLLPGSPWFWTLLILGALAGPIMTDLAGRIAATRRSGMLLSPGEDLRDKVLRWLLGTGFLMHEALVSLDAIGRTIWRMSVSGRRLLEWTSASQVAASGIGSQQRSTIWKQMWPGAAAAISLALVLALYRPAALGAAFPILALWVAAPEVARFTAGRARTETQALLPADVNYLRELARRTWLYFETFAGPEDNWLPPDNHQTQPRDVTAHRTSPTNIGLMLLSSDTAFDLGYIGATELAARTSNVFDSLSRLERHAGHIFNWYDTVTLKPLEPRYVSTVDSGNLAACLLAHAAALREAAAAPALAPRRWTGLDDVLRLLEATVRQFGEESAALVAQVTSLRKECAQAAQNPDMYPDAVARLHDGALARLDAAVAALVEASSTPKLQVLRRLHGWLDRLRHQVRSMLLDVQPAPALAGQLETLAAESTRLADSMSFRHLYDRERNLFFIGYNATSGRTDEHRYDLLASEARLASFFAIAKRDVPVEHWFHMQRPLRNIGGNLALVSWNGSMFEYLMPRLLMRSGGETLLAESERAAVDAQQRFGQQHGVPWGVSESAFSAQDPEFNYRYQAFGVPSLGLKRGLSSDVVIAPYATALALPVAPAASVENLRRLERLLPEGRYGFPDALDFTPERLPPGEKFVPVSAYMAHHQGMLLCAIGNVLNDDAHVRRFSEDPRVGVHELLLSERIPRSVPPEIRPVDEIAARRTQPRLLSIPPPWEPAPRASCPQVAFLGNGRMASWVSEGGGGGLFRGNCALTRFRPDCARDDAGLWLYVADEDSGALWSATRQPTGTVAEEHRTIFHSHSVEFDRRDSGIRLQLEIAVAPANDVEIRRVRVLNESGRRRRLRLTSYGEVVLAPAIDDERHPAFSKLFVGSEAMPLLGAILFTRRPRSPGESPPVLLHVLIGDDGAVQPLRFETDRSLFIGRGRSARDPHGARAEPANTSGWTLDPVMSLQALIELRPGEQRDLCFLTIAADSREQAIETAERYATLPAAEWALAEAASKCATDAERARMDPSGFETLQALASLIIYSHPGLRASPSVIRANIMGQSSLWGLAISGDLPILLIRSGGAGEQLLAQIISGHSWWHRHGLEVDVVVLQGGGSAYVEPLRDEVVRILRDRGAMHRLGARGGVHLLFADQIGAEQVRLLEAVASVVIDEAAGPLHEQLHRATRSDTELSLFTASRAEDREIAGLPERQDELLLANGIGGFTPDGQEYVIRLGPGETTPAPWSNVLANDGFGCLVTESGGGYNWALNSGENRLTPWSNDPVCDPPGEALYIRDEETAALWTTTPLPAGGLSACEIRHGAGYSEWRRCSHGFEQQMCIFVARDDAVKIVRLRLRNLLPLHRRVTATYYAEWLLGALQSVSKRAVICDFDAQSRALLARSYWTPDFAGRVAFLASSGQPHGVTTDRIEFLGREGSAARPEALLRWGLSGNILATGDSCAAYQVHIDVGPDSTEEVIFVLGQGRDEAEAKKLAVEWTRSDHVEQGLADVRARWERVLGSIEVSTPDPAFNLLVNRWLIYQCLSARVMARTGFYQSSGAIGFRDQLQDVLALLHSDPARARAHILTCAEHQFAEGDVLHWWHPPGDAGVRTRCSDDLIWLPYAVSAYIRSTGDVGILEESRPFLEGAPLSSREDDRYARFARGQHSSPLLDHCERSLEHLLRTGAHQLPLIGSCDWNDGLNRVGSGGRGESVWLAWFGAVTADRFAELNRAIGRNDRADLWTARAGELRANAERAGWDGAWYRRAYDDDGYLLGSSECAECRIDSISQSWAAFAGANPDRVAKALSSAREELIERDARLARLLWPPFDRTPRDPGYIKAYPPGTRENGGQYSHAAAWLGLAFAKVGDGATALEIFDTINPIVRSRNREEAERYRVEPYVAAGDIYADGPHLGRGGWSWYTGTAAWAWRLAVEGLLGIELDDGCIRLNPSLPPSWGGFQATLRRDGGTCAITVEDPGYIGHGVAELVVDGVPTDDPVISFPQDGSTRSVLARLRAEPLIISPSAAVT
jgi:cyclic beta-1,2-glucan glucanotransferase